MMGRMRREALRTLLVVSERPHPWAFLRDRLDPELVTVSWSRPAQAGHLAAAPWMLAADCDSAAGLLPFADHLLCWRWVGAPPSGLPVTPPARPDWRSLAEDAERALAVRLAGLRLAPGAGVVLPDGSYLSRTAGLEALLAAHPDGLAVAGPSPRLRAAARRVAGLLLRHGLPIRVAWAAGRLTLTLDEQEDDLPPLTPRGPEGGDENGDDRAA
jgi:hypothetical protein